MRLISVKDGLQSISSIVRDGIWPARRPRVFGIGLSKTGTTTLSACFRQLGYRDLHYHSAALRQAAAGRTWLAIAALKRFESASDWPCPMLYKDLDRVFPDARFILTLRSTPKRWLDSLKKQADRKGLTPDRKLAYGYATPHGHEAAHLALYERHKQEVLEHFISRPTKLLVVCWESGDAWPQLCGFLGAEIPTTPFPHENRRPGASTNSVHA